MRNIRLSGQQVAVLGVLTLVVGAMVWWQTAVVAPGIIICKKVTFPASNHVEPL